MSMGVRFTKMHGAGNDFVILDARTDPMAMTPAIAQELADRHTGIGCDQLIVIEPSDLASARAAGSLVTLSTAAILGVRPSNGYVYASLAE